MKASFILAAFFSTVLAAPIGPDGPCAEVNHSFGLHELERDRKN